MPCMTKQKRLRDFELVGSNDVTHLSEKIHADQHLHKVIHDHEGFELERFPILHVCWTPFVDE